VTANFWLTVRRLRRALRSEHVWLLVVNTRGINVWCAAAGGRFTHHQVIDAVKVSGLALKVDHRELMLPALSAPGVDLGEVADATGFQARFGPARAEDIPAALHGEVVTQSQRRVQFGLRHRADMYLSMNFPVFLPGAALLAIFAPAHLALFAPLFWAAVAFLYLFMDVIPGKSGWTQALVSACIWAVAWAGIDWIARGDPLRHWPWLVALAGIFLLAGIDLAGTASPRRSDFEMLLHKLRRSGTGRLISSRDLGQVVLDTPACIGCGRCREICPIGVFGPPASDGKSTVAVRDACFSCGACVMQCPADALSLKPG
jgi:NAD-dependent dihydropyrimidine dehydrogenase PreA subunit